MDDQRSEILAPPGRVRVDEPLVRPVQPGGVVSHRPRRSWGRRLVWLLLAAAIVAAAGRIVNSVPAVVAAEPGILTTLDLPLVTGTGLYQPAG